MSGSDLAFDISNGYNFELEANILSATTEINLTFQTASDQRITSIAIFGYEVTTTHALN